MNDSDVSPLRKQFLGISDAPLGPIVPYIMGGTLNLNPPLKNKKRIVNIDTNKGK